MSIILNALRIKNKNDQSESKVQPKPVQGLIWGDKGKAYSSFSNQGRSKLALLVFLLIAAGGAFYLRWQIQKKMVVEALDVAAMHINQTHKDTQKIPEKSPPDLDSILKEAQNFFKQGKFVESGKRFELALTIKPNSALIHNAMGLNYIKQKLYFQSKEHFEMAVKLDESCAECYNNLGYYYSLNGNPEDAENFFKKSIGIDDKYADPFFNLAVLYEKYGDVGKAKNSYSEYLLRVGKSNSTMVEPVKKHLAALEEH